MSSRRQRGRTAEQGGITFLERRGYRIVERNYAGPRGELDVIAEKDGVLCFVEIRSRRKRRRGRVWSPAASVGAEKQRRIARTARDWLVRNKVSGRPCRFDVLSILEEEGEPIYELFQNAFETRDI